MAGINLANILQNVEQIKSARQAREMNALRMQQAEKQLGYMDEDRAWEMGERQNTLDSRAAAAAAAKQENALRSKVAEGDQGAMRQFIALKPDEGKKILEAYDKMGEQEKKQAAENVDAAGRMAAYILQSENPEQAYERVRQNVNPEMQAGMPEQYDRNYVTMQLARAREIEQLLKPEPNPQVDVKTFGDQDIMFRNGQEVERTGSNALLRAQQSGREPGQIDTAQQNLVYKMAASMFGGLADPITGQFRNMTESDAGKVQAIAAEAIRLMRTGDAEDAAQAAAMAARKLKIDIPDLSGVKSGGTLRTFNPATGKFE